MKDSSNNSVIRTISRSPVLVSALLTCILTYVAGIVVWGGQFIFGLPLGSSSGALPEIVKYDLLTRLLVGSLAAPIVETFLFQWLPIRLIRRTFGGSAWSATGASALVFSATHGYSVLYVAVALWGGLIFATVFVLRDYPGGRPFLVVATAHAVRNTLASILI
ncbi:CPBP family intramembrane metalloprotease [Burkholderia sp. AU42008]|uniref:CPBP family glutamic-type intramembrane protease n=1 Tax=unclassified Burkholderia TaxID=2613784 RepID=UPI000B7AE1B9|nr:MULTISPECIES: CPBP family glutamic-type intramembrane protease [unclassified Burkholderia]MBR8237979.1 CPBP family intramembrane metalloprotease [Burkholderia sp. AU32357]MBY4875412.1 CPBP family intramembrane metalloprotease [Burkholderia sp. AU42008]OXI47434.1 CPBP family intramembrane metalloprotease [Burkholderia sp. AU17457]